MSLTSLLWKTIPKPHRKILLDNLDAINQYPVHKLLSGDNSLPKDFINLNCIFIHVPKCAGTSVKSTLFKSKVHGHMPLWYYEKTCPEFYKKAYKFAFVRHPLERAYSAFHYIYNSELSRNISINEVVRHYGNFDDFVHDWLSPKNAKKHIMFCPQFDFLSNSMGILNMDFIGKQESLSEDFQVITKRLGLACEINHQNPSIREADPSFNKDTLKKIYDVYSDDFKFFGYGPL